MVGLKTTERIRRLRLASVIAGSALLGGCLEGTEVNGKIFDLLGVSTAAQERSRAEPKMATRSGLVLPPNAQRLPEPGSGEDTTVALNDPDKQKALAAAERERQHKQYCSGELSWKERAQDPNAPPTSPYGPCSLLSGMGRPNKN